MCYLARMAFFSISILISTSVSFRLRGGSCLSHGDCFFKAREDGEEAWRRGGKRGHVQAPRGHFVKRPWGER